MFGTILEPTSGVEVAFPAADQGVFVGEPLIRPYESLCREEHFVVGLLELPEYLFWAPSKD